jgi:hypothetical protein
MQANPILLSPRECPLFCPEVNPRLDVISGLTNFYEKDIVSVFLHDGRQVLPTLFLNSRIPIPFPRPSEGERVRGSFRRLLLDLYFFNIIMFKNKRE